MHLQPFGYWNPNILEEICQYHCCRCSGCLSYQRVNGFGYTGQNGHLPLRWRHNDHAGVSNHQPHGCLLNRLFRRKSKKTSELRVTGLCAGNSPGTGEFPAQMASYAENVSIWWRHDIIKYISNIYHISNTYAIWCREIIENVKM